MLHDGGVALSMEPCIVHAHAQSATNTAVTYGSMVPYIQGKGYMKLNKRPQTYEAALALRPPWQGDLSLLLVELQDDDPEPLESGPRLRSFKNPVTSKSPDAHYHQVPKGIVDMVFQA